VLESLSPLLVSLIGLALTAGAIRPYGKRERGLIFASYAAHVFSAFAQVLITSEYYSGGDMTIYFDTGALIADVVTYDPGRFLPELWALIVHEPSLWPFPVLGEGGSTGTMSGISGLLQVLLGESIYAVCVALSVAAFFGQLALYRVFRELFPESVWPRLLLATMLVPSVVFWSSAILKETIVIAAFGWVILGLHRFVQRSHIKGIALVVLGGFWIAMVKAYVLFALAVAAAVWWYWRRALEATGGRGVAIRPFYLVLGLGAATVALVVLGEIFPRFAFDRLGEEAAYLQRVGAQVGGGSYYQVASQPQRSLAGQLVYMPLALFTSLFRPIVFEVRNVVMIANAVETTVFAVLLIRALAQQSWRGIWRQLTRSPTLIFATVFVFTFGIAVGLVTTNLGTLSRYRIPLIPFFVALLLLWTAPAQGDAAPAQRPEPRPPVRSMRRRRADLDAAPQVEPAGGE
jgi:hypothetical protein